MTRGRKPAVAKVRQTETPISERFALGVCERLREGKAVRRKLPGWGRVHIDRRLPFLVVYRRPPNRKDPGTHRLVLGEASYLLASGASWNQEGLSSLVRELAQVLAEGFGSFLIIEVWTGSEDAAEADPLQPATFQILRSRRGAITSTVDALQRALAEIKIKGNFSEVEVLSGKRIHPPGLRPLLPPDVAEELNCHVVGVEVPPVFRNAANGDAYPLVLRVLHRGLSRALKRAFFQFTQVKTSHNPAHYLALGRRRVVKAVWDVDRRLAAISNEFDFLLSVSPTNPEEAWNEFRRARFETVPEFASRPLTVDPILAKRRLYQIPIERIEDPVLAQLFQDQQLELDRKLTMLSDRGTPKFLYGSLQVYGSVDESLLNLAYEILNRVPSRSRDESQRGASDAKSFAARAEEEIEFYRRTLPEMATRVHVRKDISGLMVSRGNLLVGARTKVPKSRVEALLAHEVGTHIVTYLNGRAQPFRQLYVGLPGYDELQEGLAVLAEHLVGGLGRPRLRLLAARVVAVRRLIEGASFVEVFREIDRAHDFAQRTAFVITMRVFRGGGLTKDMTYLRGLVALLAYLREGGEIEPLLVGKLGADHIPIIEELRWREVLAPAPLRPRYLDDPAAVERLSRLRRGASVLDLVTGRRA